MNERIYLVVAFILSTNISACSAVAPSFNKRGKTKKKFEPNLGAEGIDDSVPTTVELISKDKYPVENHTVHTEDGYILELHRIPRAGAIPVLCIPGFSESSASAVIMGPGSGLAYILYDEGYDVWLGNVRGVIYSQKHEYLDKRMKEFWDFTFHEMGIYDLTAFIDFIIDTTGFEKIHYIGYSQGTTAFWIMCSLREEYNDKIIMMNALAPVAFLSHTRNPALRIIAPLTHQVDALLKLIGNKEFLPSNKLNIMLNKHVCQERARLKELCALPVAFFGGFNSQQTNLTTLPTISGHIPAGVSAKQIIHFAQLVNSGKFTFFDYGAMENFLKYGSLMPPVYNLKKVKTLVALHYALNDQLSVPRDVRKLAKALPNVHGLYLVLDPKFAHLDFMFGIDVKRLLYDKIISVMRSAERDL